MAMTEDDVKAVLRRANALDSRAPKNEDGILEAWHSVLKDSFREEALQAVTDYYSVSRFPIMPADILEGVSKMPPWSSNERCWSIIKFWIDHPHSEGVESYTGIQVPVSAIPEGVEAAERDSYLIRQRRNWAKGNKERLIRAMKERKFTG